MAGAPAFLEPPMRILFLGKRHYTGKDALLEPFGRIFELPAHWHRAGHEVALRLIDYRGMRAQSTSHDGFRVKSIPARSPRQILRSRANARADRPDVVVASGDCFIGLLGWWMARACGARFVFDVYDDYRAFGGYRAFLGWDAYGFLLRHADLVLYASNALAQGHAGGAACALVPNGIDPTAFQPLDQGQARARVGLANDGTRWVGYFGAMDEERGAADLIEAVGRLQARDAQVRLLLCGHPRAGLDIGQPWVDFRGPVEHARIPDFINACDVVALPYRRGPILDMASSCKIAEYLACRRPMVATQTPNMLSNFPVQAAELGQALCRPGDPVDLARAIDYQLAHGVVASAPLEHTWDAIAGKALSALESLPPRRG